MPGAHLLFTLHVSQYSMEKCGKGEWLWGLGGAAPTAALIPTLCLLF